MRYVSANLVGGAVAHNFLRTIILAGIVSSKRIQFPCKIFRISLIAAR